MLKNYFKTAWRNILKYRFYSAVNLIGLSTGIAFTLLISVYVWGELQVNKHIKDAGRQYIIQNKWVNDTAGDEVTTLGPLAKALKENYPTLVANYYRWDGITSNVSRGTKVFREGLQMGDSTMLRMFGFKLLYGNASTALSKPYTVVITADKAEKYFGKQNAVGETLTIENFSGARHGFTITGVLLKPYKNSVTWLDKANDNGFFISADNLSFFGRNMNWANRHIVSYIELQKGVRPEDLKKPMTQLIRQNAPTDFKSTLTPYLVSLKDYYLSANNGLVKNMLYAVSAIALFILIMAIINFVNMSVASSGARMREIGIRKVLGGLRRELMVQFLIESILIVLFATLIAFIIYGLTKNLFGNLLGEPMPRLSDFPLYFICFPVLFVLTLGTVAGIYPAFVLSSLKPVNSVKAAFSGVKERTWLRKVLVSFQFATATIAFIAAIIISKQVNFFLKGELGYNKDYILSAQLPRDWTRRGVDKMITIRNEFSKMPQVKEASLSFEIPDGNNSNNVPIFRYGHDSAEAVSARILENDENFLTLYQIPLAAGDPFKGNRQDSLSVILNETAVNALGWKSPGQAIGQRVLIPGNREAYVIKGVTRDFHFGSMRSRISPVIMFDLQYDFIYRYLSLKLKPGSISSSVNALNKKWSVLIPGAPFNYTFMDDTLKNLYETEIRLKRASYTATALALIIVLLGILGLVSLSIKKRTKEIGIRKVLGASCYEVAGLFLKEFLFIVPVAGIVACILAYTIMQNWLNTFAYRINITPAPFAIAVFLLGLIAAGLIVIQATRVARANPVNSLRSE